MARSGGFEPPTAWFVARYSIQLSYERATILSAILKLICCSPLEEFKPLLALPTTQPVIKMAVREGFEPSMGL